MCRPIGASAGLASVVCPSLGETGSSSMMIVADFRGGIGPIPGAYWQDGKDHRLAIVIAIVVLAAVYLLMRRKRS